MVRSSHLASQNSSPMLEPLGCNLVLYYHSEQCAPSKIRALSMNCICKLPLTMLMLLGAIQALGFESRTLQKFGRKLQDRYRPPLGIRRRLSWNAF